MNYSKYCMQKYGTIKNSHFFKNSNKIIQIFENVFYLYDHDQTFDYLVSEFLTKKFDKFLWQSPMLSLKMYHKFQEQSKYNSTKLMLRVNQITWQNNISWLSLTNIK